MQRIHPTARNASSPAARRAQGAVADASKFSPAARASTEVLAEAPQQQVAGATLPGWAQQFISL
jgi:hypothetical protein